MKSVAPDDAFEKSTNLRELEPLAQYLREQHEDERYMFSVYGVTRNVSSVSLDKSVYGKKDGKREVSRASFASTNWKQFFNWYYERENEENRMKTRFNIQYHDESLDAIRECLKEVFPDYKNLRVEDKPTRFVIDKAGKEIDFEKLSDGEKCYITLVLDIARRLSLLNDGSWPLLDGEQIILIDEVDLHLHPSWQLQILSNLERKFPNCQFFVSSHSWSFTGDWDTIL